MQRLSSWEQTMSIRRCNGFMDPVQCNVYQAGNKLCQYDDVMALWIPVQCNVYQAGSKLCQYDDVMAL